MKSIHLEFKPRHTALANDRPEFIEEVLWHDSPEGRAWHAEVKKQKRQFVKLMFILLPLLGLVILMGALQ